MQITRNGSKPSGKCPPDCFTRTARVNPLLALSDAWCAGATSVTFEPAALMLWNTHPLGRTLIMAAGLGVVQREGPIEEIRPDDLVFVELGERHWDRTSPTTAGMHVVIQGRFDGTVADWHRRGSDSQYLVQPEGA